MVTNVLQNFSCISATIQFFKVWKSSIMDQSVTFPKQVYNLFSGVELCIRSLCFISQLDDVSGMCQLSGGQKLTRKNILCAF